MCGQRVKMLSAIACGVLLAFVIFGLSTAFFPEKPSSIPIYKQKPIIEQLFWAFQWIGIAALIAATVVGAFLLIHRVKVEERINSWILTYIKFVYRTLLALNL